MLTAQEDERLRTWLVEIVETLLEGVEWQQEGDERRAKGYGGLTINVAKRCWYIHAEGKGGVSAIPLIEQLKGYGFAEALAWANAWAQAHPGTGRYAGADDDHVEIPGASLARDILEQLRDPAGTVAETYLRSRGITGALPACVRFLPYARIGESAVVGLLTAHGRVVGCQVGYLDPDGCKSTIQPYRRRYSLEKAPDAVFELPAPAGGRDPLADTLITEGLEDVLSLAELDRPMRFIGLPGIAALKHLPVKQGERVIVVRDGDEPGSAADKALTAGIDALLFQGATVNVTRTPPNMDANSVLQCDGIAGLEALVADTYPAELSVYGEITRLSRLDRVDYDRERKSTARKLGVRAPTLDHEVGKRRRPAEADIAADPDIDAIELLDGPVELKDMLDDILAEFRRYIVADDMALATVTVWCAHTHLCQHHRIRLQRSPRLAIQARTPGSGKTTLLEAVGALVPRPRMAASVTASTVCELSISCTRHC